MAFNPQTSLLIFGASGYISLHSFSNANGFFELLNAAVENGADTHDFVPIKIVNDICNFFVAFFWPCVDGNHPGLSLACFVFASQWVAGWALITMEAYRAGNKGYIISYIVVFGLLYQSLGLGLCAPLYLLAHLATSPTASTPTMENTTIPKSVLLSILPALSIGMVLPTIAMSLPAGGSLSLDTKATLVLVWQFFPVWTSLLCFVLPYAFNAIHIPLQQSTIRRLTYRAVILVAGVAHMSTLTLSITPLLAPTIFNPTAVEGLVSAYLSVPPWPMASPYPQVSSIAEGAFWFIQYDYILTSLAFLFWSISLKLAPVSKDGEAPASVIFLQCFAAIGRAAVLGPLGSAASLIWERDETLMVTKDDAEGTVEVKKTQ